MLSHSVNKLQK